MLDLNPVSIITGLPGGGKSYTVKTALDLIKKRVDLDYLVVTPTGKAATLLKDPRAMTAHRIVTLMQRRGPAFDRLHIGEFGYLFFDESSMFDSEIVSRACGLFSRWRFVFVGDNEQLPPVGAGDFFTQAIASGKVPTVVLESNHRQSEGSYILPILKSISLGRRFSLPAGHLFRCGDEDEMKRLLLEKGKKNVRILCHKTVSADKMNRLAEEVYLGPKDYKEQRLRKGMIVRIKKNFYNVTTGIRREDGTEDTGGVNLMNGMEGEALVDEDYGGILIRFPSIERVVHIDSVSSRIESESTEKVEETSVIGHSLTKSLDDVFPIDTDDEELSTKHLEPSFAMTVHASQGSEYDTIIFYTEGIPGAAVSRRLLYTALSRAKKDIYCFMNERFQRVFVDPAKRHDNLKYRLTGTQPQLINPCPKIYTCNVCDRQYEHPWPTERCSDCSKRR